ncbi:MAG: hypothetical protein QOF14_2027 [Hyphomicrobiales bacterium]|jgi:hypothetical protein|nr:hypothetical protein [Hyphomicrobiales bacterium]
MSKSDEYRENAAECQKMARLATNPGERATWLEMASDWLRMIPKAERSAGEKFDDQNRDEGTHQDESKAEH